MIFAMQHWYIVLCKYDSNRSIQIRVIKDSNRDKLHKIYVYKSHKADWLRIQFKSGYE